MACPLYFSFEVGETLSKLFREPSCGEISTSVPSFTYLSRSVDALSGSNRDKVPVP